MTLKDKYKDMSCEEFNNSLRKNCPNTCSDSEHNSPWGMFGVECGKGWWEEFESFCYTMEELYNGTGVGCKIAQFKEKFGGPRLYTDVLLSEDARKSLEDSPKGSASRIILENLVDYVQIKSNECEKRIDNLSEITGERLSYTYPHFSRSGWIWGSDCKEVYELYTEYASKEKDEDKKKKLQETADLAKEQMKATDLFNNMRNSINKIIRYSSIEEVDNLAEELNLTAEKREKEYNENSKKNN